MAAVAILIPLMRPQNLAKVVQSIAESTEDYRIIVMAATGPCFDAAKALGTVDIIEDSGGTWPQRINAGYEWSAEKYVFAGADDLRFTPGWFEAAMRVMETVDGVVAVNDLMNFAGVHFLFSRHYIETLGGALGQPPGTVIHPAFQHCYSDDFARRTAIYHGRWGGVVKDSVVEHLHCGVSKSPSDDVYRLGESTMASGLALYQSLAYLFE